MTQTETQLLYQQIVQISEGLGLGVRRRKRLPESFPAPFQCPNETSRDPTRAQPWSPNLLTAQFTNTYVVGTPRAGHFG